MSKSSLRREIVFSVALAETYLLECVRDDVLKRDYRALDGYFPPGARVQVEENWKTVPARLREEGRISGCINFGQSRAWCDFATDLVVYRNGLVHGRASRPGGSAAAEQPQPSIQDLASLKPGWAFETVRTLILELNAAAET
jgi:hypothetical protein